MGELPQEITSSQAQPDSSKSASIKKIVEDIFQTFFPDRNETQIIQEMKLPITSVDYITGHITGRPDLSCLECLYDGLVEKTWISPTHLSLLIKLKKEIQGLRDRLEITFPQNRFAVPEIEYITREELFERIRKKYFVDQSWSEMGQTLNINLSTLSRFKTGLSSSPETSQNLITYLSEHFEKDPHTQPYLYLIKNLPANNVSAGFPDKKLIQVNESKSAQEKDFVLGILSKYFAHVSHKETAEILNVGMTSVGGLKTKPSFSRKVCTKLIDYLEAHHKEDSQEEVSKLKQLQMESRKAINQKRKLSKKDEVSTKKQKLGKLSMRGITLFDQSHRKSSRVEDFLDWVGPTDVNLSLQ